MPLHPRASTPHPTVPPPDAEPEPALERAERRLKPLHTFAAVAVALVGLGAAWSTWEHTVAKLVDVDALRTSTAVNLAQQNTGTSYQLNALQNESMSMRDRMTRVETALAIMGDDVKFMREQLVNIAKATHAQVVKEDE